jgi:hypothetical protein
MRRSWLLCVLCSLLGCSGGAPVVSLEPVRKPILHSEYGKIRGRWTRQAKIIKKLDTTLRVHATCFSPEFIAAYVARRARLFRLPKEKADQLRHQLMAQWSEGMTFLVAASTIDFDHNDFDRSKTIWRVTLENDRGQQLVPSQILSEKKNTATITEMFPYVGRFHRVYTFTFPKKVTDTDPLINSSTERFTLHFSGPLGHAALVWRLQ